jgi:Icc protein
MRLLHLSDTHLHELDAVTFHPEIDPAARLDLVLEAVRPYAPFDAIMLTGDVCDDGSTYGADGVRDRLAKAYPGVRVIAVPGNHDRTEVVEATFDPAPVRVGGWRVIPVSTNVLGQTEGEAGPPAEALATALAEGGDEPLLMLQHHPLRSNSTHEWFVLNEVERLAAAVADVAATHRPLVLLTGHTHQAFQSLEGSVHHIGAPSTYYAIEHDGNDWRFADDGTGALIIELGDRAVESVTLILA